MDLEKMVIKVLKSIEDPELKEDVYSLRLVRDIQIDKKNNAVKMKFRPTVFRCPVGIQLAISVKRALMDIEELSQVDIEVIDFFMADQANLYLRALDKEKKLTGG